MTAMTHTSRDVFGVEPFDVGYGAAFAADADSPLAIECPIVEDDGVLTAHDPAPQVRPNRIAFVDGTMRTDARLSRTDASGVVSTGLAGSWAAGAVFADGQAWLAVDRISVRRVAIFGDGVSTSLPDQPGGWSWTSDVVEGSDLEAARQRLERLMRDAEGALAEQLFEDGWLTVVDGPLHNVRRTRMVPVIGYVKTHHRPMLDSENWARVPRLAVGQRSSLFAMGDDLYGAYFRIGDPGPWSSPWGGIVRLEVPASAGRSTAADVIGGAASWLPRYASVAHRDPRAPVNLTPIAGLEAALRRYWGDSRLALRAVRAAILELNATGVPT